MIEKLYVQNFRCLESMTLDFSGKSSALIIGKNGAGKSTTRQAIAVFQGICRGPGRVGKLISLNDFAFRRTDRPMRFEIEVAKSGKKFVYAVSFDWPDNFREARILDESLVVDGRAIFTRQQAVVDIAGGNSFGLDWHVFAIQIINERPSGSSVDELKTYLASLMLVSPIPANMLGFSDQSTDALNEDASNYASCLRGLLEKKPAAYGAFDTFLRSIRPDFSSIENVDRGKDGKQLMVTFMGQESEETLTVEFDALSDGEKCYFIGAYIIASSAAGVPIVCMWDEPDNHLSLSEIGQFIVSLRKMARHSGQFIVLSHHPETVRKFSDENTFVLTRKSHLDPTISKLLSDFNYNGDLIDALIRDEVIG
ncbi:MAG: hypothetical protein JWP89_5966 [Schlesneria sp.]|nr:hypothetical protein [Schlesneria sp.]